MRWSRDLSYTGMAPKLLTNFRINYLNHVTNFSSITHALSSKSKQSKVSAKVLLELALSKVKK